jgi:Domain of unknown function (DU1801)
VPSDVKTAPTGADAAQFIASIEDPQKREDSRTLLKLLGDITGEPAVMWGSSIVGFGSYHYRYASGHEGDACIIGFSPRKQSLTIYLSSGLEQHAALLAQLGKHSVGKGCLYIKRLSDVDPGVLSRLLEAAARGRTGHFNRVTTVS